MKRVVLTFVIGIPAVIFIFVLLFVWGANLSTTVTKGVYGPLEITQTKEEVVAVLRSEGIWPVEPVVFDEKYLENPTFETLTAEFSNEAGLMVWLGPAAGVPMRIEFKDDIVTKSWPIFRDRTFVNPHDHIRIIDEEYVRFEAEISLEMSRIEVFGVLSNFNTTHSITVSNFVVGNQYFRELSFARRDEDDSESYLKLVMDNNAWRFYGLKEAAWHSRFFSPFNSRVTLYFSDGKLERIEHLHSPIELP